MTKELIEQEKKALTDYLLNKDICIEIVKAEIGEEQLETLIIGLAVMEKHMETAIQAMKNKDFLLMGYYMGAGAKRTKDDLYSVLLEQYGGIQVFIEKGNFKGIPSVMMEYIDNKYEGGVKRLELLESSIF